MLSTLTLCVIAKKRYKAHTQENPTNTRKRKKEKENDKCQDLKNERERGKRERENDNVRISKEIGKEREGKKKR